MKQRSSARLSKVPKPIQYLLVLVFWVALWLLLSKLIGEELLFPSPLSTLKAWLSLCTGESFWVTVGISFQRILVGILISLLLGILGGTLSGFFPIVRIFFAPLLSIIRSAPVASFIVLLVLWMSRDSVPTVISGLMVLPVIWASVEEGITRTDSDLIEMAKVFSLPWTKRLARIYLPSVSPFFRSAVRSSLGMAWKAGIAAEVIVLPMKSIGRQLYYSSNNLETAQVFAWTATVILLGMVVDFVVSLILFRLPNSRRRAKREPAKEEADD